MALLDQVLGYLGNQPQPKPPMQPQSPPMGAGSLDQPSISGLSPIAKGLMLVLAAKAWQAYSTHRANSGLANEPQPGHGFHGLGGLMAFLGLTLSVPAILADGEKIPPLPKFTTVAILTTVLVVLAVIVLSAAVQKWISVLNGGTVPATAETA